MDSPLVWEKFVLDLGDMTENETKSGSLTVTNKGDVPVIIKKIAVSCGCTSAKIEPEVILPGKTGALYVELAAQGRRTSFASKVDVNWADQNGTQTGITSITAQAHPKYVANISPSLVNFGSVSVESPSLSKDIEIARGTQKISFSEVVAETSVSSISAHVEKLSENKWKIFVTFFPYKLPSGSFNGAINIIFRDVSGHEAARKEVPVDAEIKGLVTVKPKALFFGVLKRNESREGTLLFDIPPGRNTAIKSFRIDPDNDCIKLDSLPGSSPGKAQVSYKVSTENKTGNLSGQILVDFEDEELGEIRIPVILYAK